MPDPYHGMLYSGSHTARQHCMDIGISINDAMNAARDASRWGARDPNHFWNRGRAMDIELKVLVEVDEPARHVLIKAVHRVRS